MTTLIRIRNRLQTCAERLRRPKQAGLSVRSAVYSGIEGLKSLHRQLRAWTRPNRGTGSPTLGAIGDLRRSKPELVLENALLRKQLSILGRQVRRPRIQGRDRLVILTLARLVPNWRDALLIVKPATVLGWHRRLFKIYWRRKSRPRPPRMVPGTAALIRRIALENVRWGAEKIRGELLKLGVKVSKRTVQRIMWKARRDTDPGARQTWRNFVSNHHRQLWACDFVQVHDLLFRSIFAFFIIDVPTRRVVHVGVTRCPTDRWVTQQLREATAWDRAPKYLLLDNDSKFGVEFDALAKYTGIKLVHTAVHAPLMNAVCERFIGSVRRECLDHMLILSEAGMRRLVEEYVSYFNDLRPHQGLGQRIPAKAAEGTPESAAVSPITDPTMRVDRGVVSLPVLGGLHHHYHRLAA
jgi:putative transposase